MFVPTKDTSYMQNVMITAPSLDEKMNVSGISTIVKSITTNNKLSLNFRHFQLGKSDIQKRNIYWFFIQVSLLPRAAIFLIKNRIDIVHLNTSLEKSSVVRDFLIFLLSKKLFNKKVIFHVHGGFYMMQPPTRGSVIYYLISQMFKGADLSLVLSENERRLIKTTYAIESVVLPNAVQIEDVVEKDFSGTLKLIFFGRVVKSKGIYLISEAMKSLKKYYRDFEFHIYGSGVELDCYLDELNQIEDLRFEYKGIVIEEGKKIALSNSHIFLLPSDFEGLPMALLESMSYGCIPVVSDDVSLMSVVKDGCNGYIIRKRNVKDLTARIVSILESRSFLKDISSSAKSTIKETYGINQYLVQLNKHYSFLLK